MRNKHFYLVAIAILFLSSCATTRQFVRFTDNSTQNPAPKARIYVLRTASFKAGAIKSPIYCNGEIIGKIGSHGYLCWDVEEGTYNLNSADEGRYLGKSQTENKDFFTIKAKAGKTYYIKQNTKMSDFGRALSLSQLSESEGIRALKGLKKPKLNYAE